MTPTRKAAAILVIAAGAALGSRSANGEPMFLSKQYTRCTSCHYSPTGGGLLTPYGRSISLTELSTATPADPQATVAPDGEQAFLFGLFGDRLGPLNLGVDLRPSRLELQFPGGATSGSNLLMTADVDAAYQANGWTAYGTVGRQPGPPSASLVSYEHWVSHEPDGDGFGFRVGRFLPAYGINFADHTAFTRAPLGFDFNDQVYGAELDYTTEHELVQATVSPGRAESIVNNDGRRAFMTAVRFQHDLSPRTVLVASGLYRDASAVEARSAATGLAFGVAPASRVSIWTEADLHHSSDPTIGTSYVVVNETGIEAVRGLWLKVSPQIRTEGRTGAGDVLRMALEADWLVRTHWNVDLSYDRDDNRRFNLVTTTFLAQLHLYL